jgi:hypothetical protein
MGSKPIDILFDYEKGHLKISEPLREAPLDLFAVKNFDDLTYTDKILFRFAHHCDGDGEAQDERFKLLDESLQKHKANMRRLSKLEIATALNVKDIDTLADTTGQYETPTMMARRCVATEQAKEILEVVEAEGRAVTDFEVLQVLRLWDFRKNTARNNVMKEGAEFVYSDTVGIVADYTGHVIPKEELRRYPAFSQLLNRWLRDNMPDDLGAEFVYTSININKNYAGKLHRDGGNVGPSFIKALGDFRGGELNYFPEDDRSCGLDVLEAEHADKSVSNDISKGLFLFDGKRGHWVNDFEGERYTLVFFTCPRYDRISDEGKAHVDAGGFPFPTEESMDKLLNVLRKPAGYGKHSAEPEQGSSVHNAPFLFWSHADEERASCEAQVEEFWKARGLRKRLEGHEVGKRKNIKREGKFASFLTLGKAEPGRKDLLLHDYRNMNDAAIFLNNPKSVIPEAITESGCAAVFSIKSKQWYAIYLHGTKDQAMAAFGLTPKPKKFLPKKRGAAKAEVVQEGGDSSVATPKKKRKAEDEDDLDTEISVEKHRRSEVDEPPQESLSPEQDRIGSVPNQLNYEGVASPQEFREGDVVEVRVKFQSDSHTDGIEVLVGQRGTIKQVDDACDLLVHFHDHSDSLQWVSKHNFGNLSVLCTPPSAPKRSAAIPPSVLPKQRMGKRTLGNHSQLSTPPSATKIVSQLSTLPSAPKLPAMIPCAVSKRQNLGRLVKAQLAKARSKTADREVVIKKEASDDSKTAEEEVALEQRTEKRKVEEAVVVSAKEEQEPLIKKEESATRKRKSQSLVQKPGMAEVWQALAACSSDAQIKFAKDGKTATSHKKSYERYAAYSMASTLPQAMELGASGQDILYDYQAGLIQILTNGSPLLGGTDESSRYDKLRSHWASMADKASTAVVQGEH